MIATISYISIPPCCLYEFTYERSNQAVKHPSKALAEYYLAHNILPAQTVEYMEYALHSILDELIKLAIYTVLFAILGTLSQYTFILIVLFPIRWAAGGLHSKTFWGCFFYSLLMFIGLIYVAPFLPYPNTFLFLILGILALSLFLICLTLLLFDRLPTIEPFAYCEVSI